MRALDVPARVVTGYQGADPEPQDGCCIVRQSHAHAWAEYWEAGTGWVRVDPTAAVAPDRVQRSLSLRPPPGLVAGAIDTVDPALALRLRNAWESVNNRWNQWVLNYSRGQQFDLLRDTGLRRRPSWQDLATLLIGLLCGAALAGAGWAWWDRRRQDPWQRLQRRVQQRLARAGRDGAAAPRAAHARRAACAAALGARARGRSPPLLDALDRQRYAGRPRRAAIRGGGVSAPRRVAPLP